MSIHFGRTAALVSYRLGTADGVSVTATQWAAALRLLGVRVWTVAGEGRPDVVVPGLERDATRPPSPGALDDAFGDADLVVLDNICSLPVNRAAGEAVADHLRGRPALLRHHDLPWERSRYAAVAGWPPDDPAWRHVTISETARRSLAARRGIAATTIYHGFAERPRPERRAGVRAALGVGDRPLVLQPTRAIARKNIDVGLALAESLDAAYWLTGPAEDGYAAELDRLLRRARVPVRRRLPPGVDMAGAYAACDAVVLPSSWEGFGLPLIESALHRRPIAVGDFPVARELAGFGFRWFPAAEPDHLRRWLAGGDRTLLVSNEDIANRNFGIEALARHLDSLLAGAPLCARAGAHHDEGLRTCDCLTV